MSSVIHIAEIAAILAVAYILGWTLGYLAHRLAAPRSVSVAAIPEDRLAAATGVFASDALVKAPVIEPVAARGEAAETEAAIASPGGPVSAPQPELTDAAAPIVIAEQGANEPAAAPPAPDDVPIAEALAVAAELPIRPEPIAAMDASPDAPGEAVASPRTPTISESDTSSEPVTVASQPTPIPPAPAPTVSALRRFRSAASRAAVAPVPIADPAPATLSATPARRPGVAWTGEIRGRAAEPLAPEKPTDARAPEPAVTETESPAERTAEPSPPASGPPSVAAVPPPVTSLPSEPVDLTPPAPPPVYDEDAAMRAIEGGWSRVKAVALSDTPELSDMGAAVAAATTAVEQVLARAGIDADAASRGARPRGLPRPRSGAKDDLKRINGLGALDESTLNNLGVYHFDQIAAWNDAQVVWMENHVFARGRIGREDWQGQARELANPAA